MKRRKSYKFAKDWLFNTQKGVCAYCKAVLNKQNATVDHATPLSRGGYNKRSNYVLACKKCNFDKGTKTKSEFEKEIRQRKLEWILRGEE